MSRMDKALIELGQALKTRGYRFTTPTPATHAIVNARPENQTAETLEQVFGWSRCFEPADLPQDLLALLDQADALGASNGVLKSKVRFSTLGSLLFLHSQFPTTASDSVFFGPDTYRFARALQSAIESWTSWEPKRIADIGCGTGAGGFFARTLFARGAELILGDINEAALRYARINAAINDQSDATIVNSNILSAVDGDLDLIVANPPYLVDPQGRVYRNGGGTFGESLSLEILKESIARLSPDGRLVLYTGTAIVGGKDQFFSAAEPLLKSAECAFAYEEIDPDVFGEELNEPAYASAERIAVVALTVHRRKERQT